ncbi:MAG TPA: SRPBCC family protein [Marmoricola sp.]|nr:SRPBCC family protein [Marmoricola sp.]
MPGREITVSRVVHAAPEQVWAVLTDLDAAPTTLRGVSRVERVAGPAYDVGTRWRETRRILGKEETQELEVTAAEEPRRTTVEARSGGVEYRTVFTLEPADEGTLLSVCFGASHPDPTWLQRVTAAVFGPMGAAMTTKLLAQDLADIAAVAEDR